MPRRILLVCAMTERKDPLIDKLIERLRDRDPVVRRNAAGALRLHGPRAAAAIAELQKSLADEDAKVRAEVQRALQRICQVAA